MKAFEYTIHAKSKFNLPEIRKLEITKGLIEVEIINASKLLKETSMALPKHFRQSLFPFRKIFDGLKVLVLGPIR